MPIYTSRQLLDPNMLQMLSNEAANRLRYETELNKVMGGSIRNLLTQGGKSFADYNARKAREAEVEDKWNVSPEIANDPNYKAAREEYIRTGSSAPMSNYIMQVETQKARNEAAKQKEAEAAKDKAWHDAVRIAQARPEYGKVQKAMFDAADAGDYETAEIFKKQLQAYETEFGPEAFGGSAEEALENRRKSAEAKAEKEATLAEDIAWQKEQEKKSADKSYEMRNFIIENFMPVGAVKDKNEQIYLANLVRTNKSLNEDDKKYLLDKIYGETKQEQISKAATGAVAAGVAEDIKEAKQLEKKTKELADQAKKALEAGYKLTADEQDAYNKVYGGK